jgi:ubiquinone/menaquinone biosynthesis C-methylase UbiE
LVFETCPIPFRRCANSAAFFVRADGLWYLSSTNRLYTHRIMPWTATWIARDSSGAYRYLPRSVETFLDRARLAEALRSVGFAEITQKPLTFGTCVITVAR